MSIEPDVLIVGSGAAGLTAALNLAETHKVAVIAKGALGDSASARAQGGGDGAADRLRRHEVDQVGERRDLAAEHVRLADPAERAVL